MDLRHFKYLQPGTPFFDEPLDERPADFDLASEPLPDGWSRSFDADWCHVVPPEAELPEQGWKIHVSATLVNAGDLLADVAKYCIDNALMFKFIRSAAVLLMRNSKYGDRSASGKFMAIYPTTDDQLAVVLQELDELVGGEPSPYILSDLRYNAGPLYVRYGGFASLLAPDEHGRMVHCIRDPHGTLVPDERKPGFHPPSWVDLPDCLADSLALRAAGTLKDFPYRPVRALHFSNGGGVYEAKHVETGDSYIMKEARPMAGLDGQNRDAVERLEIEHAALDTLCGLPQVPAVAEYRKGHEHFFLVRELVDGDQLMNQAQRLNPLMGAPTALSPADYTDWALAVLDQIEEAIDQFHARGLVFGDVHPGNIFVRSDNSIAFIDYECAMPIVEDLPQRLGAPGFQAPPTHTGGSVDRFGLGCLRLAMFVPYCETLQWGSDKTARIISEIEVRFPVPASFAEQVWADLAWDRVPKEATEGSASLGIEVIPQLTEPLPTLDAEELRKGIVTHILANATPHRSDRLFPGDAKQFLSPGAGVTLAHGAAGVLHSLHLARQPIEPEHIEWLKNAVAQTDVGPGLYDGLAGVAVVLHSLGEKDYAVELFQRAVANVEHHVPASLYSGRWGVALGALAMHRQTSQSHYLETADKLMADSLVPQTSGRPGGLMFGPAGAALVHLVLGNRLGESSHFDSAASLLLEDADLLRWTPGGAIEGPAPWCIPSLGFGSAGTMLTLVSALQHLDHNKLKMAAADFAHRLECGFLATSGLLTGRSGMLATAAALGRTDLVDEQLASVQQMLVRHGGGYGLLGEMNLRLSCDLITGSAGLLHALAVADGTTWALPFVTPEDVA